jgi:uncharacterized damage-inducible protein DinB
MNWTELLTLEIEENYRVADELMSLVDADRLDWKPATGSNWMTTGQLLEHISQACGINVRGFVTGDWGASADLDPTETAPEDMLPTAETLPAAASVDEARARLRADRELSLAMLAQAGEERIANEMTTAPWDAEAMLLGRRLLHMIDHLAQHKGQLFYYLKLMGKPVNTMHLWGM